MSAASPVCSFSRNATHGSHRWEHNVCPDLAIQVPLKRHFEPRTGPGLNRFPSDVVFLSLAIVDWHHALQHNMWYGYANICRYIPYNTVVSAPAVKQRARVRAELWMLQCRLKPAEALEGPKTLPRSLGTWVTGKATVLTSTKHTYSRYLIAPRHSRVLDSTKETFLSSSSKCKRRRVSQC